jgi:putative transposase
VKFGFIAKHRGIWAVDWLCGALGVSRGGFYAWLKRPRSRRSRNDEELGAKVRASFLASDRTYGARRVWKDLLADRAWCGLHRIERLMRLQALKARPRRRRLPPDLGERQVAAVAANVLDRTFAAPAPNRKWIADFTYIWTAQGWLYVAVVIDLFSRRVVGWSMNAVSTPEQKCIGWPEQKYISDLARRPPNWGPFRQASSLRGINRRVIGAGRV